MGKIFANDKAYVVHQKLRKLLKEYPKLMTMKSADPDREAMLIVGNICMDDHALAELSASIDLQYKYESEMGETNE
tara:strand:- start:3704 stop:3931 length:228 start_codon:yes stop_codon:yes gene_type:complete